MKQKKTGREYRRYDSSFKAQAVQLMLEGRSVKELSQSLGVSEGLLYQWRSKSKNQGSVDTSQIKALKRENKDLREQNEILKKALSIFSQSP